MQNLERNLAKQIDDEVLYSSEEKLRILQELDRENQLTGKTFYDVYLFSKDILRKKDSQTKIHDIAKSKK